MKIAQWIKWSGLAVVLAIGEMTSSGVIPSESDNAD